MGKVRQNIAMDMVTFSRILSDTKAGIEYDEPFSVEGAQEFSYTVTENEAKVFYDARLAKVIRGASVREGELTFWGLNLATAAKMWNDAYDETTGQYTKVPGAPRPEFAMQARNQYVDENAKRYFTYYKISLAELSDEQIKNMAESYNESPLKVKITIMETVYKEEKVTALGDTVKAPLVFDSIDDDVVTSVDWETEYFAKVNTPAEIKAICAAANTGE